MNIKQQQGEVCLERQEKKSHSGTQHMYKKIVPVFLQASRLCLQ